MCIAERLVPVGGSCLVKEFFCLVLLLELRFLHDLKLTAPEHCVPWLLKWNSSLKME